MQTRCRLLSLFFALVCGVVCVSLGGAKDLQSLFPKSPQVQKPDQSVRPADGFTQPGDPAIEVRCLAKVDQMNGKQLLEFLEAESRTEWEFRTEGILYVGRMKHRALERVGELRLCRGIKYLIRDINFWYPAVGSRTWRSADYIGQECDECPAVKSMEKLALASWLPLRLALISDPYVGRCVAVDANSEEKIDLMFHGRQAALRGAFIRIKVALGEHYFNSRSLGIALAGINIVCLL